MNELTIETINQLYEMVGITIVIEDGAISSAHIE